VFHLLTSFYCGGTERQAAELLNRLDLTRYDVRLAVLKHEGMLYEQIAERFPVVPEFRFTGFYNANACRQYLRLRDLLRRERIDLVHAHDFYAGVLGVIAGRLAGVRVLASQRHLVLSDRRIHEWGQRFINRFAHKVLVNSEAIKERILATSGIPAEKIIVIRNGFIPGKDETDIACHNGDRQSGEVAGNGKPPPAREEICRELGLDRDVKLVGMVGRLEPVKGHRFFVEAAARVAREHPNVHFLLVGDGQLKNEIQQQAANLGVAERLHLLGYREDATRIVAAFDLSVLASLHEGLPNTVLEAMAAGVPVVATAVGGAKELVIEGETGYLAPPADADTLARRISWALAHEEERMRFAASARESVRSNYGMSRMVSEVERLYDQLVPEKERSGVAALVNMPMVSTLLTSLTHLAQVI
jgi:glycosyltransferase involved in cell wall biosynthesis